MFKTSAKLFLSANNNVDYAIALINECKQKINNYEGTESSHFKSCQKSINECNVGALEKRIKDTWENLMNTQADFAAEYYYFSSVISQFGSLDLANKSEDDIIKEYSTKYGMDENEIKENLKFYYSYTEHMSEEEKKVFVNSCLKEYNYSLLSMLEKYDESNLTPEMQNQLEIQKTIVSQYDLQDKMSVLATTSQEYIDLFKKSAECDKKLLKLSPNLTDEEKASALKEYEAKFNSTLEVLELNRDITAKSNELKKLEQGSEAYYKKENEIRQLQIDYYNNKGNLTEEEKKFVQFQKDYIEVNNYYIAGDEDKARTKKTKMFDPVTGKCVATADEIAYENADWWGRVWMNTKTVGATFVTSMAGVGENIIDGTVMLTAGTVGYFNEDVAKWTEDFVSVNWTDDAYDGMVLSGRLNEYSAYSEYHTVTDFITTTSTYIGLSFIPGVGGSAIMASAGAGSTAQTALDNGATFNEALGASWVSGSLAFAADFGLDKLNSAKNATQLLKITGRTVIGVGEPAFNTIAEYGFYGYKNSSSIFDYAEKTGAYTNMAIGGIVTNVAGAYGDYQKAKLNQYKTDFNAYMDSMTDAQRSQAWADYYSGKYGDANVYHSSGIGIDGHNGSFVDPKASEFNVSMDKWYETFSYKKDGDRLHDITELKNFISSYTSDLKLDLNNYLLSQKDIDDIVAIYYTRGTAEFDEISTILKQYSDDALHVSMDNYVWKQASADLSLYGLDKIESYAYHYDSNKGIVIDYVARDNSGNTVNRSISRSVDDFDLKVLKDRDDLLIDMILHKEDDLIKAGKVISPIKEYDSLIHWNSAEESWNNMTDVAKQEFLKTSPNIQIASDGTTAQFGFFSFGTYVDGNNITSLGIPDSTAIGKTQWSTELISLRETLSNTSTFRTVSGKTVEVNVMNLSDPSVFTDQDIAELADVLTARPRATKAQDIRFIAHDVNKTPLNVTSNSYAGANNQYAGNSSTMANVREINAGPVDKNTSIVLGVDGIRKMFIEMLK